MLTLYSDYNEYIKEVHSNQSHYFSFIINKGNENSLHTLLFGSYIFGTYSVVNI